MRNIPAPMLPMLMFFGCLFTFVFLPGYRTLRAQSEPLRQTEAFILSQLSQGKSADLSEVDQDHISAKFLEKLITGRILRNIPHQGIRIEHAKVEGELDLSNVDVHHEVDLIECELLGQTDLSGAHFFHDLSFESSHFGTVSAGRLIVDGDLNLRGVRFGGEVDFAASQIGGSLYAYDSQASQETRTMDFDHTTVKTIADFSGISGSNFIDLGEADVQTLILGGRALPFEGQSQRVMRVSKIDLEQAIVRRQLIIRDLELEILHAPGLSVAGRATIERTTIKSEADLTDSHFGTLVVTKDVVWPNNDLPDQSFQLAGITFGSARSAVADDQAFSTDRDLETLLDNWIDKAAYSPQPYQQLEQALQKAGRPRLADLTFERMKQNERSSGSLSSLGRLKSILSSYLIGYGRRPEYSLLYAGLPIVLVGCIVFWRQQTVQPRRPRSEGEFIAYDPFWYSVALFVPLATLDATDMWIPRQDSLFLRTYARIHSLLGWILVPIGLAAITGLIPGK
jgi:hypothetical protein